MKKFIAKIRKIADRTSNVRPYNEARQDAYMADRIKRLLREAFEAGAKHGHSHYVSEYNDDAGFTIIVEQTPTQPEFKTWFKEKYK